MEAFNWRILGDCFKFNSIDLAHTWRQVEGVLLLVNLCPFDLYFLYALMASFAAFPSCYCCSLEAYLCVGLLLYYCVILVNIIEGMVIVVG
jgi:hypothetical protein